MKTNKAVLYQYGVITMIRTQKIPWRFNRMIQEIALSFIIVFGYSIIGVMTPPSLHAQSIFNSGSTGADGELVYYSPPRGSQHHEMVYDSNRNVVVLFGGLASGGSVLGNTLEWDGRIWSRVVTEDQPTPRYQHAMAYDSNRNVTVLFGGFDSQSRRLNDVWEYDGANWVEKAPASADDAWPSARELHAMTFHAGIGKVVLFGGRTPNSLNDTWTWDGTEWKQLSPAISPTARYWTTMVYDSHRHVGVLFGGTNGSADTWEFDGTNWNQISSGNTPAARWGHAMAYDPIRRVTILFGSASNNHADTWAWNGTNWEPLSPAVSPSGRGRGGMVFDEERETVVLFGGGNFLNDTWLFNGTDWSAPNQIQPTPVFDMRTKPDGIWNFTNINIPAGVELIFIKNQRNTPVVWLASGDVTIAGTVNCNGAAGAANINPGNEAPGGPGGFSGGLGGQSFEVSGSFAGTPGQGPGGGFPGTTSGQNGGRGGFGTPGGNLQLDGPAYGNRLLIPIIGGSGGGGGASNASSNGGNGGGGGGAILIASSGNIVLNGTIIADGGQSGSGASIGGRGSGGAIRLVANRIEGAGSLFARPNGRIRTEAFYVQIRGEIQPVNTAAPPIAVNLADQATIRIMEIAGQVVPADPSGNTNSPDVIFSNPGDITVRVATTNIPVGTVLTIQVTASGQIIRVNSTPVAADGSAQAVLTVPAGIGTVQAYVEYTVN